MTNQEIIKNLFDACKQAKEMKKPNDEWIISIHKESQRISVWDVNVLGGATLFNSDFEAIENPNELAEEALKKWLETDTITFEERDILDSITMDGADMMPFTSETV